MYTVESNHHSKYPEQNTDVMYIIIQITEVYLEYMCTLRLLLIVSTKFSDF